MYEEAKTLIVVYKDELVLNQLKKLIETTATHEEGKQVGKIDVAAWDEKVWLEQKKTGAITEKILFLGDIKGTSDLIPIIDVKFNRYGVSYGWAGKQAVIYIDEKKLRKKKEYDEFLKDLSKIIGGNISEKKPKIGLNIGTAVKGAAILFAPLAVGAVFGGWLLKNKFDDVKLVRQQQLMYGVIHFYSDGLKPFMEL